MSPVLGMIQKTQQAAQGTIGKGIDAAAVIGAIGVWQEWVPVGVGVVTILWLSMQIIINMPMLFAAIKKIFNLTNKE